MMHDFMVYTERAETAAVSRGTSYLTTKQRCKYIGAHSKRAIKGYSHLFRITCNKSAANVLESGEQRYIKAINLINNYT